MKNCNEYFKDISQLLDNELPPEREKELKKHLETCHRCERFFREMTLLTSYLKGIPQEELPANLTFKVMKAIQRKKEGKRAFNLRWGTILGLSLILIFAVSSYIKPLEESTQLMDTATRLKEGSKESTTLTSGRKVKTMKVNSLQESSKILEDLLIEFPEITLEKKEVKENEISYFITITAPSEESALLTEKLVSELEKGVYSLQNDSGIIYLYIKE